MLSFLHGLVNVRLHTGIKLVVIVFFIILALLLFEQVLQFLRRQRERDVLRGSLETAETSS